MNVLVFLSFLESSRKILSVSSYFGVFLGASYEPPVGGNYQALMLQMSFLNILISDF